MGQTLLFKGGRFIAVMILCSLVTSLVLLAAVPHLSQAATVTGSVIVSLLVALYDFGLFRSEFEI